MLANMTNPFDEQTPLQRMTARLGMNRSLQAALEPYSAKFKAEDMLGSATIGTDGAEMLRKNALGSLPVIELPMLQTVGDMAKEHLKDRSLILTFAQKHADSIIPMATALADSMKDVPWTRRVSDASKMADQFSGVGSVDFSVFADIALDDPAIDEVAEAVERDDERREAFLEFYSLVKEKLTWAGVSFPARVSVRVAIIMVFVIIDMIQNSPATTLSGTAAMIGTDVLAAQKKKTEELDGS